MKSIETSSRNAITDNFVEEIYKKLQLVNAHKESDAGCTIIEDYIAEHQANTVLVQSVLLKKCVLVISKNGDIEILADHNCIEVMEYTKDGKVKIQSTFLAT